MIVDKGNYVLGFVQFSAFISKLYAIPNILMGANISEVKGALSSNSENLKTEECNHGSFIIWFNIEGYYRQDLIFALNPWAGFDYLISNPAHFFCPETDKTDL